VFGLAVGLRAQGPALIRYAGPAGPGGSADTNLCNLTNSLCGRYEFIEREEYKDRGHYKVVAVAVPSPQLGSIF